MNSGIMSPSLPTIAYDDNQYLGSKGCLPAKDGITLLDLILL